MSDAALKFHPVRPVELEPIVEARAEQLALTIVRMSVEGAEGQLWSTLTSIDEGRAREAIEETAILYLFVAERAAGLFLEENVVPAYHREMLIARAAERTADLLRARLGVAEDEPAYRGSFYGQLAERKDAYGACHRMYRQENEEMQGTVIWEYYQIVLELGHETALHVLAALQIPLLHVELSKVYGELICEALGMDC